MPVSPDQWRRRMKKNEEPTKVDEMKLIWRISEKPTAEAVASLVETKVITPEEARSILFREEVKQSDEVEALKEMIKTLQGMVENLLSRQSGMVTVPYKKVIEVSERSNPYWRKYWTTGDLMLTANSDGRTLSSSSGGTTTYTLSI